MNTDRLCAEEARMIYEAREINNKDEWISWQYCNTYISSSFDDDEEYCGNEEKWVDCNKKPVFYRYTLYRLKV